MVDSWKSLAVLVVLIFAIVAGLVWIHRLRKDAQGKSEDETQVLFESLRQAYESGQMADSEFERIRTSLGVPPDRWPDLKRPKPPTEPFQKPG
ncbi:MAG TPA: hypothetical protein VFT74_08975 [Isosphaeraceae bacterium]|nr:hypothetical protein [Isosphaeraceae bacterium]